jgi:hypothetical protein
LVYFYGVGKDVVPFVVKLGDRFVERIVDRASALTDDPVEPDKVWRLYSATYEVFDDIAKIDRLAISIRKHRYVAVLVGLKESSAPSIDSVQL